MMSVYFILTASLLPLFKQVYYYFYLLYTSVHACLYVTKCLHRPEEEVRSLGTEVYIPTTQCKCWELNLCPLKEQPVLLAAESLTGPFSVKCL